MMMTMPTLMTRATRAQLMRVMDEVEIIAAGAAHGETGAHHAGEAAEIAIASRAEEAVARIPRPAKEVASSPKDQQNEIQALANIPLPGPRKAWCRSDRALLVTRVRNRPRKPAVNPKLDSPERTTSSSSGARNASRVNQRSFVSG